MASTTSNLTKEIKKTATDAIDTAKSTAESVQNDIVDAAGDVRATVQKVFLAGLGALAVAEEEGSKMFKTLVSKGETIDLPGIGNVKAVGKQIATKADQAQDAVEDRVKGARNAAVETADKAEDRVQDVVASVMKRIGVPTREEIAELTASVERLATRVETLKKEKAAATTPSMESVGGGWYEVRIGDVLVEKVQGKDEAEAAILRIQEQRA